MHIQSSCYYQQLIGIWRSNFEQKTNSVLLACWSKKWNSQRSRTYWLLCTTSRAIHAQSMEETSRWPCKDYLRGTCNDSFCEKWHRPECLLYITKSCCRFWEKCSYAHRQVDEQTGKRSQKNDDISAVVMLKKHDFHDRTEQPVVCRDTRRAQGHGLVVCNSSSTRQMGCVFQ